MPAEKSSSQQKRLRLVKVIVQPHFVVDGEGDLVEMVADPVVVTAKDWPRYASEIYPTNADALERQINDQTQGIEGS